MVARRSSASLCKLETMPKWPAEGYARCFNRRVCSSPNWSVKNLFFFRRLTVSWQSSKQPRCRIAAFNSTCCLLHRTTYIQADIFSAPWLYLLKSLLHHPRIGNSQTERVSISNSELRFDFVKAARHTYRHLLTFTKCIFCVYCRK